MPSPRRSPGRLLQETREQWPLMNHYERFEHMVAFILGVIIALVIALALLQRCSCRARSIRWITKSSRACSG